VARSKVAPAGRVWTTAPETSIGRPAASVRGVGVCACDSRHEGRAPAADGELGAARDDDRGVLVDADPDEVRGRCDHRHEAAVAGTLREVLIHDAALEQAESGGDLARALAWGGRAFIAHGDHEVAHDRCARGGAAYDRPALIGAVDRRTEGGAGQELGQPELAAAAHEDAGGLVEGSDVGRVGGGAPAAGVDDGDFRGSGGLEDRGVGGRDLGLEA
jgi:hypothetical protein